VLNALCGNLLQLTNVSEAHDTKVLTNALQHNSVLTDVDDAGTAMRFLSACFCALNQPKIISGSDRMKERPIGALVNALSEIGFDITCIEKEGFPPVQIKPLKDFSRLADETFIEGNISSQFITALLLIAPFLSNGLKINFTTPLVSRSYIEMTISLLEQLGITSILTEHSVEIKPKTISSGNYHIGADWSAASYWYSIAFLADEAEIFIEGLQDNWVQGDRVMADWMNRFGVQTEFTNEGALIKKVSASYPKLMKMNFTDNPDLAQTFAVMFAAKNICSTFSGIETLKIKETDRIAALHNEMLKVNVHFDFAERYEFYQLKGTFAVPESAIETYGDHRMAMSFAPLALLGKIEILNTGVVEKSYPGFWCELEKAGFTIHD
jgi:3-phosphoshikimate 1-carboxyvinyltransferase